MGRRVFLIVCASLVALCAAGRASASTQELTLHMDDGVDLAATLYEPSNAPPPAGYPAIVLFHGIGGKRQDLAAIAQSFDDNFAVLAFASVAYLVGILLFDDFLALLSEKK